MVSVPISLPSRGAFHLSLTVLVHYRSQEVLSLGQWSARFPTLETFRVVLEDIDRRTCAFTYWAVTVFGRPFQARSVNACLCDSVVDRQIHTSRLTTPAPQRLPAIARIGFGLFPFRSPLLRECFLFLEVLRCFSSLGALHAPYVFRCGSLRSTEWGSPIRRCPDQRLLPAPRTFSQVTASFIGLLRQGIHRAPFVA